MPQLDDSHGLVIQVTSYAHVTSLPEVDDANAIASVLVDPALAGYPPQNVRMLTDDGASRAAILASLDDLATRAGADATVFVYFSGHGGRIADGPHAGEYLLPVDALYQSAERLAETAISGDQFASALAAIAARRVVVVFDCCHAGGLGTPKEVGSAAPLDIGLPDSFYGELTARGGRVVFASSRHDELSFVPTGERLGLFTSHLLSGLRGGAAGEDGAVRVFDLFEHLQPRVTAARRDQHPVFKAVVEENFAVTARIATPAGRATMDADGFHYDAYVSYASADADFVWEAIVPALAHAGLRVAVSDDVAEPGVARVVNAERGVRRSRRTLAILSDAYISDGAAEFENVVAQTIGVDEGSNRVIPVVAERFDRARLPVRLSMLTAVDLTRETTRVHQLDRLVAALRRPPSTP
jgi:hypothetical protein